MARVREFLKANKQKTRQAVHASPERATRAKLRAEYFRKSRARYRELSEAKKEGQTCLDELPGWTHSLQRSSQPRGRVIRI